jgi:hypothetical protein
MANNFYAIFPRNEIFIHANDYNTFVDFVGQHLKVQMG